jgi:phage terminase large subunit-like protein
MPETPPEDPRDLEAFKFWNPEAQERALELLKQREQSPWRPFYCPKATCDGNPHDSWDFQHARQDQRPPKWSDDWLTLLLSGGRGSGKTRTGSEITHRVTKMVPRIILIGSTGPDLRDTMIEGESGLLATAPPDLRPKWEPSKKRLTWPNGCIGQGFSAEEPDRLRGPQSGYVWADEPAHWPLVEDVWSNMLFGLRLRGKNNLPPHIVATSTPKPTKWMKELMKDERTIVRRVATYANLVNLADAYKRTVIDRYEGTRLGKQELYGELLEDVEGALWNWDMFQWIDEHPALKRIVVSVDPAGTANAKSDLTGIVVVGIDFQNNIYVLADASGRYSPGQWADKAVALHEFYNADAIVAEKNYGGDMVKHTLENSRAAKTVAPRIILVESRRGKQLRAEPIVALYEKRKVKHVSKQGGDLAELEGEQTEWVPGEGASPNRVDALVHGITDLAKNTMPSAMADPNKLLRERWAPSNRHLRAI